MLTNHLLCRQGAGGSTLEAQLQLQLLPGAGASAMTLVLQLQLQPAAALVVLLLPPLLVVVALQQLLPLGRNEPVEDTVIDHGRGSLRVKQLCASKVLQEVAAHWFCTAPSLCTVVLVVLCL